MADDSLDDDTWYVDSPAVGAGLQPRPCGDSTRPASPAHSADPLAVTFSGGGFRATLASLGVVRLLADIGLLGEVRYVSSVSGGSVANGVLAASWPKLRDRGFTPDAVDDLVIDPFVRRISRRSLKVSLILGIWRTVGPSNRTNLLARRFDSWFFHGLELEQLDPQVRWIVNAANLVSGSRFTFERDVIGDYTVGLVPTTGTGIRLSTAAAASAAVPGAFAPLRLRNVEFPCGTEPPALLDGGAYDNTGLEAIDSDRYRETFVISLNSGGLLRPGAYGKIPLVRELAALELLAVPAEHGVADALDGGSLSTGRFGADRNTAPGGGTRRGVLTGLATQFPDPAGTGDGRLGEWRAAHREVVEHDGLHLAKVPTVFDEIDESLCRALVHHGWWLTGAALALHHPTRMPDPGSLVAPRL